MGFNDEYTPSGAVDCSAQLLAAVGDTSCPSDLTIELAEINVLHLDEKDETTPGSPKNPILTYTEGGDNEAVILTWRATHDNTVASKVRTFVGTGEKPEPTTTTITLHKGVNFDLVTRHTLVYTINIMDDPTYLALRTLQANKGQYHMWNCTDTYLHGGDKGVIVDVEKVVFPKTGGRGENTKCIITMGWNAKAEPLRDVLPYEVL